MKVIEVDLCRNCPHNRAFDVSGKDWKCELENRKGGGVEIPDWCPLPDASQSIHAQDATRLGICPCCGRTDGSHSIECDFCSKRL